jgi:hypothetical protein
MLHLTRRIHTMTNDTQAVVATGPWLKWAWRYYNLSVDEFTSYDEAIRSAQYMADAGEESLDCIEGPLGRVDSEVVQRDISRLDDEAMEKFREAPKATHGIKIKSPDGKEAWYSTFYDEETAELAADRLRASWGADRVRLFAMPA